MNLRLFILLIVIESLMMVCGVFGLIFFWFFYFGSGAGASSEKARLTQNIMLAILVLLPLVFGVFKHKNLTDKGKAKSYLYSGLIVSIVSIIYFGMSV